MKYQQEERGAQEHPGEVDTHVPQLAGPARNEGLVDFIADGPERAEEKGEPQAFVSAR